MPSNLYLFDPKTASGNSNEKPLVRVLREAEQARAKESAAIARRAFNRIAGLFRTKSAADAASEPSVKTAPADETRLAA